MSDNGDGLHSRALNFSPRKSGCDHFFSFDNSVSGYYVMQRQMRKTPKG